MSLASLDDINKFLPQDKIPMLESDDDALQLSAERTIKGYLSDTFTPTELAEWVDPAATPDFIQEIAGRFIAALYYRQYYAEDMPDLSNYAKLLYTEALQMLLAVRDGTATLLDVVTTEPITPSGRLEAASFFPDDSTEPVFTMDAVF